MRRLWQRKLKSKACIRSAFVHTGNSGKAQWLCIAALLFIVWQPGDGIGGVNSYTKNGNDFSSVSGEYATATHCASGDTCSWVVGDGMVLGVY